MLASVIVGELFKSTTFILSEGMAWDSVLSHSLPFLTQGVWTQLVCILEKAVTHVLGLIQSNLPTFPLVACAFGVLIKETSA